MPCQLTSLPPMNRKASISSEVRFINFHWITNHAAVFILISTYLQKKHINKLICMANVLVHTLSTQPWSNKRYTFFGGALVSQIVKGGKLLKKLWCCVGGGITRDFRTDLSTKLINKCKFASLEH